MSATPIVELAKLLENARLRAGAVERLTLAHPELNLQDAYRVQEESLRLRVEAGDRLAGYKMGLTSKAKMKQMGVDTPIMGILTESMRLPSGETLSLRGLIHPRIEPEVAFILERDLSGAVTAEQALDACSGVCAAMEIIDSRYRDFSFTLPDVVADNGSGCAFVLGPATRPRGMALGGRRIDMSFGGKVVQSGNSDAIFGDPAQSLAALSALLASQGKTLKAGSVVLAGSATQAVALEAGVEVRASVEGLGDVSVRVAAS